MTFRLLPHTADLRAAIDAPTADSLYQAAVDLVRQVLVGSSTVQPRTERHLSVDAPHDAERFFRYVRELLYLHDAEHFLPAGVRSLDPLVVAGEVFDPERHESHHQLKAVTRHGYAFRRDAAGYHVELVFDL